MRHSIQLVGMMVFTIQTGTKMILKKISAVILFERKNRSEGLVSKENNIDRHASA